MSHAHEFDEYGHKDHGHVIVSAFTLRFILLALLFFTLLTVGLAGIEKWITVTFSVEIPQWINVVVALSIATVKTILVVMFFMQLKYDNPMNTVIFVFTVGTVACFIGFTAIDLTNRSTLDVWKGRSVVTGGTGGIEFGVMQGRAGIPITEASIMAAREQRTPTAHDMVIDEAESRHEARLQDITNAGFLRPKPVHGSDSNFSRPVTGVTLNSLPGARPASPAGEHGEKGGHAAPASEHPATGH